MYGQLAVDYERQFGKHKFKASVLAVSYTHLDVYKRQGINKILNV